MFMYNIESNESDRSRVPPCTRSAAAATLVFRGRRPKRAAKCPPDGAPNLTTVFVCMFIYIYIHICVCIYIYKYTHICIYV